MSNTAKDKKIFVTGATGFAGSYLVRELLRQGYTNILALRRESSSEVMVRDFMNQITWIDGDILDLELLIDSLHDIDWVFHAAAIVSFEHKEAKRMIKVNVEGTANLINACLEVGIEKFLHYSSVAAIGNPWHKKAYSEVDIWKISKAHSNYSISKFRSEQEVWRGAAEGLNVVIINPTIILGAGIWNQNAQLFFSKIQKGFSFVPTGGTGFVDVRDVSSVAVKLMSSDISQERFILNAENKSYKDFFKMVAGAFDKKPPSIVLTPSIGAVAWRIMSIARFFGFKNSLTKDVVHSFSTMSNYDNSKIKVQLDFTFRPLVETVQDTSESYRASVEDIQYLK